MCESWMLEICIGTGLTFDHCHQILNTINSCMGLGNFNWSVRTVLRQTCRFYRTIEAFRFFVRILKNIDIVEYINFIDIFRISCDSYYMSNNLLFEQMICVVQGMWVDLISNLLLTVLGLNFMKLIKYCISL